MSITILALSTLVVLFINLFVLVFFYQEMKRRDRSIKNLWEQIRFIRKDQRLFHSRLYELDDKHPNKSFLAEISDIGVAEFRKKYGQGINIVGGRQAD